ncbi:MAG TPA: hypothetical protein VNM67_15450 [Thermoanaerobaculia bacterium]|jgi:hypothetical protein|nr:hypothetical protein [Thermoanaerobaculia bacterium]
MSSKTNDVDVQVQVQPEPAEQDSWLPETDPSLKPERVQDLLQQQPVREQVSALLSRLATCDRQRIRLNVTAKRAVFTVEGVPRAGTAGKLMQTALKLGHVA